MKNNDLYIIKDLPITKRLYITSITQPSGEHPPKQVGIHQKFTYDNQEHYNIHPRHSGETNIGRYMTLIIILKDRDEIYRARL